MPFGFGPAVVLALIWYFGYYKNRAVKRRRRRASAVQQPAVADRRVPARRPSEPFRYPGPATPFTEAAEAWRQRMEDMRAAEHGYPPMPTRRRPCADVDRSGPLALRLPRLRRRPRRRA